MTILSNGTLDDKAELIFDLYDFDGSKYISRDELTVLMTNALCSMNAMAKKPRPTTAEIEKKTNEFFEESDVNKDNQISLKEFKSYLKRDADILHILFDYGVAKLEDMGTDMGGDEGLPMHDSDLEAELNNPDLERDEKMERARQGLDF